MRLHELVPAEGAKKSPSALAVVSVLVPVKLLQRDIRVKNLGQVELRELV